MKEKANRHVEIPYDEGKKKGEGIGAKPWGFEKLNTREVIENFPIMTFSKGAKTRLQLPIHESTEIVATRIREKYPHLFRIDLDVFKTMIYAGRMIMEYHFLKGDKTLNESVAFKLASLRDDLERKLFVWNTLEEVLNLAKEAYLSQKNGTFSGTNGTFSGTQIWDKIEELAKQLGDEGRERVETFIDDEIENPIVKERIQERLRKREYRRNKQKLGLKVV